MKTFINLFILVAITFSTQFAGKTVKPFNVVVSGSGPSMFLIPGATSSGSVWDETVEKYKNEYTVHVFTLAGYAGVAPLESDEILPVIKDSLAAYILKHKEGSSILVGHSIGGFLGMWMASENNYLVDKIIIVDALPFLSAAMKPAMTEEMAKTSFAKYKSFYTGMDSAAVQSNQKMVLEGMIKNTAKIDFVLNESVKSDSVSGTIQIVEVLQG